jgi:hypothetical protein
MEEMINITVTAISLGIGLVLGAFWMFVIMRKDELAMMEELDSKTRLLESYEAWVKNGGDKDEEAYGVDKPSSILDIEATIK